MRACGFAAQAAVIPALSLRAATIRDDVPDSSYIALAADPAFAASGFVETNLGNGNFLFGSGTLIAPNWVLTTARLVTSNTVGAPAFSPSQITFGQGTSASFPGSDLVQNVLIDPGWAFNNSQGNDLALLQLSAPITSVQPANLYSIAQGTEKSQTATAIGYGTTGTGLTGFGGSNTLGTRRGVQNVVDAFGGQLVISGTGVTNSFSGTSSNLMFVDFDEPGHPEKSVMGDTTPLPLEGLSTPGDNGGGLFLNVGGSTYLAGVNAFLGAFSGSTNGTYGNYAAYTRTSSSRTFIAVGGNWGTDGNGSWSNPANWPSGIPTSPGSTANFGSVISAPRTLTLDGSYSLGMIVLNNSSSYNITPGTGGTLTMDNSGLPAQIFDARGNHIISAPMILNDYTTVTIANNADTLNLAGSISGPKGLTINGPGNLILWGSNSYSGGTLINSGILTAAGVSSLPGGVSVLNNGALVINASNTVGGIFGAGTLTIGSGATLQLTQSASLNWQSKLTILGTGNLDITNSSLTLAYGANPSPNAAIQSYLASGYNAAGALWTGTGISSSMAAANPARYSIAFADGADGEVTHLPPGISNVIPNGGALPAGTELITYALPGDANLDGKVDFNDFVVIATHFLQPDINWDHGNFNYDSRVDFLDFVVMATNFGAGVTTSAGEGVSIAQLDQFNSFAAANGISQTQISTWDHKLQSLPDPGAAGMGLIFTFFLLRGRRQRVVNRAANPDRPACVRSPQVRTCRDHAVEHTCR